MTGVAVYMEGGGQRGEPNTAEAKAAIRQGMGEFFTMLRDRARRKGWRWKIVPCGDRTTTKNAFLHARAQEPDMCALLLVDSEWPVTQSPKQHLKDRDGWDLAAAPDDHVHLMAQVMETWLVADPKALAAFYGQEFNEGSLPSTRISNR